MRMGSGWWGEGNQHPLQSLKNFLSQLSLLPIISQISVIYDKFSKVRWRSVKTNFRGCQFYFSYDEMFHIFSWSTQFGETGTGEKHGGWGDGEQQEKKLKTHKIGRRKELELKKERLGKEKNKKRERHTWYAEVMKERTEDTRWMCGLRTRGNGRRHWSWRTRGRE